MVLMLNSPKMGSSNLLASFLKRRMISCDSINKFSNRTVCTAAFQRRQQRHHHPPVTNNANTTTTATRHYYNIHTGNSDYISDKSNPMSSISSTVMANRSFSCIAFHRRPQKAKPDDSEQHIVKSSEKPFSELTLGQKVKQTGKDASYTAVIVIGVGITGVMFYMIGRELFSNQSPSGVYGKAVKELKRNYDVTDIVGEPLKAYGEMTRRGRRRHVSHIEWVDNNSKRHMRMKFYIEGPLNKGTVHLEVHQNESGKFEYRYLFVEFEGYPPRTVVIEDNR
ncbi:mitochondrial import inner membrane translocase subunit Tim21-like [Tubulanus polymorphus]|uniref:mitochondrial import inner membrane translocase subunit Tim21-like n=1 Tax=Tubulanus polymorphus TaxID=672921 RepID=UPI003DA6915F